MRFTVRGSAAISSALGKGRKRWIFTIPTRSPRARNTSTVSSTAPQPDPISTTTRSASGAPTYSTSP